MAFINGKEVLFSPIIGVGGGDSGGGAGSGGVIDLANIEEVESIDNPTESSPTAVKYDGEIYILVKEN